MKTLRLLLPLAAMMAAGCQTDSYDTGEGAYSHTTATFAEAQADSRKQITAFETDEGLHYRVTNPATASWVTRADSTYRTIVYYDTPGDGSGVRLQAISQVPVLAVRPAAGVKEMKTDPAGFESLWMSRNGRYLNLGIILKVGQTDGSDKERHVIGMTAGQMVTAPDGRRTLPLTLYHDQGGVPAYYSQKYYVSIPASALQNADSVALSITTWEGPVVKRIAVKDV